MYEGFEFKLGNRLMNFFDFRNRKFPCKNDAACARLFPKTRRLLIEGVRLRGNMHAKRRRDFL